MNYTFALCGNPNVGKTSLYNRLTHSSQHVGNWHGVTVGKAQKKVKVDEDEIEIVDLPGLYSLSVYSYEESISRDEILSGKNDLIINVCEANNLARNLYLTLQLLELNVPVILVVNMIDELNKRGLKFNAKKLENRLHIPVLTVSAKYKFNADRLLKTGIEYLRSNKKTYTDLSYLNKLPIKQTEDILAENIRKCGFDSRYASIKTLENDEYVIEKLNPTARQKSRLVGDLRSEIAKLRYEYIDEIIGGLITEERAAKTAAHIADNLDKIMLNKFTALPIFLLIMSGIFWVTFGFCGKFLTNCLENAIGLVSDAVRCGIEGKVPEWIKGLICTGIIDGVGSVLAFLPQIVIMFFFLALLEDSGYISRVAFMTDGMFRRIGLSGRAAFTMIMGLGCSATAVMTARGLEDEMMRKKTVILTPFMSCSARLPVYTSIAAAFFTSGNVPIIFGLYLLGVLTVIALAAAMEKTPLKSGEASFVMEMPRYRMPTVTRIMQILLHNEKNFIVKVGTVVLALNVIVWILGNFSFTKGFVAMGNGDSIMEQFCSFIAPVFAPLGFGNWRAVTALVSGLAAKEVVISTITSLGGMEIFPDSLAAIAFMVYTLLYVPCIATLSAIRKEAGTRWMIFGLLLQLTVAYFAAFAVRMILLAFSRGIFMGLSVLLFIIVVLILLSMSIEVIFKERKCVRCPGVCNSCK